MKSYAMALDLRDDAETIERYKEYHRAVWDEVLDGLRSIGISKMKIFLRGNRLFMYLETPGRLRLGARLSALHRSIAARRRVGRANARVPADRAGRKAGASGGRRWKRFLTCTSENSRAWVNRGHWIFGHIVSGVQVNERRA